MQAPSGAQDVRGPQVSLFGLLLIHNSHLPPVFQQTCFNVSFPSSVFTFLPPFFKYLTMGILPAHGLDSSVETATSYTVQFCVTVPFMFEMQWEQRKKIIPLISQGRAHRGDLRPEI